MRIPPPTLPIISTCFRRRVASSRAGDQSGSDILLCQAVEYIELLPIPRPDISTYVPSAHMFYYVMYEMGTLLITNRYFSSELLRWTPLHSRLYYGILLYVQILRAMDSVGCLTTTNEVFLRNFDENHPYSSLHIAGPWVPFFKALIACDSVYPDFGPISLYIPVTTDMLANQHGSLPESTRVLLPNFFGIRNAIASTRRAFAANAHAFQWDHNLGNGANNAGQMQPAHNVINNTVTCDARITPGRVYPVPMPQRTMDIYATSGSHIRIPPSADPLTTLSWQTYLGFAQDFSWFGQLSAQMVKHVCYFKGSTTLDSCSPRN